MSVRSLFRRVKRLAAGKHWEDYTRAEWDQQYESSTWTYLPSLEQMPRYAIVEAWRRRLKPSGSVLDLGCGEGTLFDHIPDTARVDYTGIDLSQVAIARAGAKIRDTSRERFVCGDLTTLELPSTAAIDVIVFNEILYYFPEPVAIVQRYLKVLAPGGIVIVSLFHENLWAWKAVHGFLAKHCLQTTVVRDEPSGKSWHLGVYAPNGIAH